ncbi:MAG TPA: hypothetical protein VM387_04275 [Gemmatimonadales bacterium]|nr:hypothetical protein [Gemmatimonadales bacterium]
MFDPVPPLLLNSAGGNRTASLTATSPSEGQTGAAPPIGSTTWPSAGLAAVRVIALPFPVLPAGGRALKQVASDRRHQ